MKKFLYFSLLCCSISFAAEDWSKLPIGPFSGLNNYDSPVIIPSQNAQSLLNVDITPNGKSVKKRKGYATAFTFSNSTSATHGNYLFYDSNGNDVVLTFNDRNLNSSVNGGSPTVIFSTGSNGATYQCIDSLGYAYCANSGRTSLFKTEGTTATMIPSVVSTGTMVTATPDRLVMSGFSEAPNRIDFSKSVDFTTWQPGPNAVDPVQFTINAPGSKVTHITYAHGRIYWFKDTSFGYIIEGSQPAAADWQAITISPTVGTFDNTSILRYDILYFRGNDSHIYSYDGANLVKLSREITTTINSSLRRQSNSWSQTSQSDFSNGVLTHTNITESPGNVILESTSAYRINYATNTGNECASYQTPYYAAQSFISTRAFVLTSASIMLKKTGTPGTAYIRLMSDQVVASTHAPNIVLATSTALDVSGISATSGTVTGLFTSSVSLSANTTYWIQIGVDGTNNSSNYYPMQYTSLYFPNENLDFACGANLSKAPQAYYWLRVNEQSYYSTGTYDSQVHNSPSLTSWDSFNAHFANVDGSHAFSIRSSTGIFYATATAPAWTSIANGAIPTISTNPYFQIRDLITAGITTTTPVLNDFTQNWFEGSASDKAYGAYHENAIWWSVTSTGTTTNNTILRWDLLNNTWNIYNIPMNGMYVKNNSLYFGSPTVGKVYKFGDVDSDDGSAINAFWKSKDFIGDDPFTNEELATSSIFAGSVSNSTMTVIYTVNGSSSTSYSFSLGESTESFINNNRNLPAGKTGNAFNFQFGNNAANQPFEVFGCQLGYRRKPWIPSQ